jgi:hypothetical protein
MIASVGKAVVLIFAGTLEEGEFAKTKTVSSRL